MPCSGGSSDKQGKIVAVTVGHIISIAGQAQGCQPFHGRPAHKPCCWSSCNYARKSGRNRGENKGERKKKTNHPCQFPGSTFENNISLNRGCVHGPGCASRLVSDLISELTPGTAELAAARASPGGSSAGQDVPPGRKHRCPAGPAGV